jgi:hypothetical protein
VTLQDLGVFFGVLKKPLDLNWVEKIEIYLIGVSLKSIQSHGFRIGKSGISIGEIPSNFA